MFEQISDVSLGALARLLSFFYSLPVVGGNYGVAIILLTVTVMIFLMPLTLKATRSTIKMTQMQPRMKELQQKYKGPEKRQELNAELMALYQEEGINPVGGCLPMLAQLPVFLLLFNVLRGLTRRISEKPYFHVSERARELAGISGETSRNFDPNYLPPDTELYQDLIQTDEMRFGPFDLAESAWTVFQSDFLSFIPYFILILFVVATSYYQQKQISARRGKSDEPLTPQMQTQQQLLRILPLMSGAWSFVFPAGLVLYWATSNLFRVGQQSYITRSLYQGDGIGAQMLEQKKEQQKEQRDDDAKTDSASGEDDFEFDNGPEGEEGTSGKSSSKKKSQNTSGKNASGKNTAGNKKNNNNNKTTNTGSSAAKGSATSGNGSDPGADAGSTNGSTPNTAADREKRWAEKRAQKAKVQERRSETGTSSRVTPKGTKPTGSRKSKKKR